MDKTIYKPLKEKIKNFDELAIEVYYTLGGYNYFSGNYNPRGIYLMVKPVARANGIISSILLGGQRESGFKMPLVELSRKNQKKIDESFAKIEPISGTITDLYLDGNYQAIVDTVRFLFPNEPKEQSSVNPPPTPMSMKLLTKELEDRFAKIGCQEDAKDPIVVAKFFNPTGSQTWYATEYYPETKTFFGYVSLFNDYNDEWGSFNLSELESFRGPMGLSIERDRHCGEKPISQFGIKTLIK